MAGRLLFELDILGHIVPVTIVPHTEFARTAAWGEYSALARSIKLCDTIAGGPYSEAETLLHECLHAISDLTLPEGSELNEAQVLALGNGLAQLLRHNPELIKYLRKRLW